jgi:hypothetical protein
LRKKAKNQRKKISFLIVNFHATIYKQKKLQQNNKNVDFPEKTKQKKNIKKIIKIIMEKHKFPCSLLEMPTIYKLQSKRHAVLVKGDLCN